MKRILVCSQQFSAGGISRVVHALNDALGRLGYSVEIMAPSYVKNETIDISISSLNLPGLPGSLLFWELAMKAIVKKKGAYDLVMIHHPVFPSAKYVKLVNNCIVIFHGTYFGYSQAYHLYKLGFYGPYYDIATRIEQMFIKGLIMELGNKLSVAGVSPSTISELHANGYNTGIGHFVPNAMPRIDEIVNKKRARCILSQFVSLRLKPNDLVLLYVGRMDPQKQPLLVLSLFNEMVKHVPHAKLVLVGNGSLSNHLKKLIAERNDVFYFGFVHQKLLPFFYSCADTYVSLSAYEGLPNAVLEASAYGLPLILSDIPPHRWMISKKIGQGILVDSFAPVNDAVKASAILESSRDSRSYPSSAIQKEFSWDQIAEDYISIADGR
jgi:glycosyltransferase involved in cell wall biosynthesis